MLRCWEPSDARQLKDAIDEDVGHLRRWMPWAADEPQPLAQKVALLRGFRGRFDLDEDYIYGIFDADGRSAFGGSGLHRRTDPWALEIGYWLRASQTGRGLATEAAAALTRVAFDVVGVERVDIRVDPGNVASAAIPQRLGFAVEATLRRRLDPLPGESGRRDMTLFTLHAGDYPSSPVAAVDVEAFDAVGARVL